MRRRLLIIGLAIFILVIIFTVSGCSELSKAETNTSKNFEKMRPELNSRYQRLNEALVLAEKIGGKRDVTKDGLRSYKSYSSATKKKNVDDELKYARELEDVIGRLRANIGSNGSVKLSGSQELKDALTKVDEARVSKTAKDKYIKAAGNYEDKRTSWRYLLSATLCGYSSQDILEFSEPNN